MVICIAPPSTLLRPPESDGKKEYLLSLTEDIMIQEDYRIIST